MYSSDDSLLIFGKGFNYLQDGPGNRLVYHLKGCNLHCPWCSNPDGMTSGTDEQGTTIDNLFEEILSCRPMYFDGGGVTFTGGEISCQHSALKRLLIMLGNAGIHTAVETNASLPAIKELMPYIDYMIADFKSPDKNRLKAVTGAVLDEVKNNLIIRAESGMPLLVRVPLIHGFNDDEKSILGFTEFFRLLIDLSEGNKTQFELLRYHEYGKEKWHRIGLDYTVTDGFITDKAYSEIIQYLNQQGIDIIKT